jgi:hypothetical protein
MPTRLPLPLLALAASVSLVSGGRSASGGEPTSIDRARALVLTKRAIPPLLRLAQTTTVSVPAPAPAPEPAAEAAKPAARPEPAAEVAKPAPPPSLDAEALATYRASLDARRPEDHTPIFRFRHEKAASARDAKCFYCHAGLSESKRDACHDCHTVSRPRSHGVRFRTTEHGRLAALDSQKCAVCHEVEYCTECHQIAPDNHFPIVNFSTRHERLARANPRACLTCHSFEATCSECHTGSGGQTGAMSSPLRYRGGR